MADAKKVARKARIVGVDPQDFAPNLLRVQNQPPAPFAKAMLRILLLLLFALLLWATFGKLDVVATAEGKLIPQTYLKIVQPFEQGLISDILVSEGQHVTAGQVLMRLDTTMSDADGKAISADYLIKQIALRRIDAELKEAEFKRQDHEPEPLYNEALAQYRANRHAYHTALAEERSIRDKARSDLAAAEQAKTKLSETLPHFQQQAQAYTELARDGYASKLEAADKQREYTERFQDLKTQQHLIASAQATLAASTRKLEQISADYRQRLQTERADISSKLDKTQAEVTKQEYRNGLLELKAPDDGCVGGAASQPGTPRPTPCEYIIKDVATHTIGTVISPGTILMTLVPKDETLRAEVWVSNQDVGFIHNGQPTKVKLASYQFQKYGMVKGEVAHLSADATDASQQGTGSPAPPSAQSPNGQPYAYRALIDLKAQELIANGVRHALSPGMQVTAEIHLGTRTILEYLLSPVMGTFQEAGRER
ncbi:MAG: HlyD family efflux transporter periplasmic adaptor subunit [Sideroxyarcus sp.]|nr:HlyD family efflux transporter periplasmic adaptor subunit [Sideroxyarcus sp.]